LRARRSLVVAFREVAPSGIAAVRQQFVDVIQRGGLTSVIHQPRFELDPRMLGKTDWFFRSENPVLKDGPDHAHAAPR
jgi:hypothetical protein